MGHRWRNTFLGHLYSVSVGNQTGREFGLSWNFSSFPNGMASKNYIFMINLELLGRVDIRNSPKMTTFVTCKKLTVIFLNVYSLNLLNRSFTINCLTILI